MNFSESYMIVPCLTLILTNRTGNDFRLFTEKRNMDAVIENSVKLLVQNLSQGAMKVW